MPTYWVNSNSGTVKAEALRRVSGSNLALFDAIIVDAYALSAGLLIVSPKIGFNWQAVLN